ncbi:MAG TPA: LptE family protein [Blastocatellia bacterium]|nr:LptE family protein [Blastocatellia bacterium]
MREVALTLALAIVILPGEMCGYRRAGSATRLPSHIRTIAIPPFQNASLHYRVEQRFTQAVIAEVLRRGRRLRITAHPQDADAVLSGTIRSVALSGALLDEAGRIRVYQVTISVAVTLRDRSTNRVLFDNQNLVFRGEFELPEGPESLFDEEGPAVDRIAREFARSLVSTILSGL